MKERGILFSFSGPSEGLMGYTMRCAVRTWDDLRRSNRKLKNALRRFGDRRALRRMLGHVRQAERAIAVRSAHLAAFKVRAAEIEKAGKP